MRRTIILLEVALLCSILPVIYAAVEPDSPECSDAFISHDLAHTTTIHGDVVRFFESNGSGLAINDLNNDGLLDVVLGNLNGANTLLWNEGDLNFRAQDFATTGHTRAITTVDVDRDGWLDIVLTTQTGTPSYWHNNGDESFTLEALDGVNRPAYTLNWADVDADGDLDLVTGSYDAELSQLLRDTFLFSGGAGVIYYENRDGTFVATRLAEDAQALAMWLSDLDGDGYIDLVVGNDFSVPDQSWSYIEGRWEASSLLPVTTYSTMSFDAGDINNDGTAEFFAADMHPYSDDPETMRAWQPVLDDLERVPTLAGNRQVLENVLLTRTNDSEFHNDAAAFGIAATGWSWSGKFGDLNNDGYLDLYVVNGMTAEELFPQLENYELVEANQAFRGNGGTGFIPAPEWQLGSTRSGRGMGMADLDNDGDVDIVVNNLNTPSQLFENDLCGGNSLQVELRQANVQNSYGLGARLTLYTSGGTYSRDMRAISGYLSGDPARVHFGFPQDSELYRLEVQWTDGAISTIDSFDTQHVLTITR
ncbi:MAG: CRTAC1 family protein [Anaerolineae bacterium]